MTGIDSKEQLSISDDLNFDEEKDNSNNIFFGL